METMRRHAPVDTRHFSLVREHYAIAQSSRRRGIVGGDPSGANRTTVGPLLPRPDRLNWPPTKCVR